MNFYLVILEHLGHFPKEHCTISWCFLFFMLGAVTAVRLLPTEVTYVRLAHEGSYRQANTHRVRGLATVTYESRPSTKNTFWSIIGPGLTSHLT